MPSKPIRLLLFIALFLLPKFLFGQAVKTTHQLSVGLSFPALSEGVGCHLAYNPSLKVYKFLDVQAQLSYCNTKITSAFLSGATGREKSLNILVGPRIFLRSESKIFRPFWFVLTGVNRLVEERNGTMRDPEYNFGLTTGLMAEISRIVVGFAAESPGTFLLRFGWII